METKNNEATNQRHRIEGLLREVRNRIDQCEMQKAFEALVDADLVEFPEGADDLHERFETLAEEAEQVEREMSIQRKRAQALCRNARQKLREKDMEGARAEIERAAALELSRAEKQLKRRISRLQSRTGGSSSNESAA